MFSHDVTAAILVSQNIETAAMLGSQTNLPGVELFTGASPFQGCPVINSVFGRLCKKTVPRGREDTRVWYRETMFSQMVSYDFPLHGLLHEYFLYLVSAPRNPEGIANLKKAICVVRNDSIIGVAL